MVHWHLAVLLFVCDAVSLQAWRHNSSRSQHLAIMDHVSSRLAGDSYSTASPDQGMEQTCQQQKRPLMQPVDAGSNVNWGSSSYGLKRFGVEQPPMQICSRAWPSAKLPSRSSARLRVLALSNFCGSSHLPRSTGQVTLAMKQSRFPV